jgi:hypothetical protein
VRPQQNPKPSLAVNVVNTFDLHRLSLSTFVNVAKRPGSS